jgi:hypothetical protein
LNVYLERIKSLEMLDVSGPELLVLSIGVLRKETRRQRPRNLCCPCCVSLPMSKDEWCKDPITSSIIKASQLPSELRTGASFWE